MGEIFAYFKSEEKINTNNVSSYGCMIAKKLATLRETGLNASVAVNCEYVLRLI